MFVRNNTTCPICGRQASLEWVILGFDTASDLVTYQFNCWSCDGSWTCDIPIGAHLMMLDCALSAQEEDGFQSLRCDLSDFKANYLSWKADGDLRLRVGGLMWRTNYILRTTCDENRFGLNRAFLNGFSYLVGLKSDRRKKYSWDRFSRAVGL